MKTNIKLLLFFVAMHVSTMCLGQGFKVPVLAESDRLKDPRIWLEEISLQTAGTFESQAAGIISSLRAFNSQNKGVITADKSAMQLIYNSLPTCKLIRVSFAELNNGKMIFGFEFLDNNKQNIDGSVYDFDVDNSKRKYSISEFEVLINNYRQAGHTKSYLDALNSTINSVSYENTFGMDFTKAELDIFLNYADTNFKKVLMKFGVQRNYVNPIDGKTYNNTFMLNFYRAKSNGDPLNNGNGHVFDLNSLCPPGNCH